MKDTLRIILTAWATLLLSAALFPAWSQESGDPPSALQEQTEEQQQTVAGCVMLDPGHGGQDQGALMTGGIVEKDAVLTFSRTLAGLLSPGLCVQKTRDSDFGPSLSDRAGAANHARAVLFLCIHAGVGWAAESDRIILYLDAPPGPDSGQSPWEQLQVPHRERSRRFAEAACRALADVRGALSCEVRELPLPVLAGADMPAVLVDLPLSLFSKSRVADRTAVANALAESVKKFLEPAE
ncbi:MAG: N-acetylmuramoyl-L-alanine amidase [Thermodesulfobacteriota bacterium]